MGDDVAALEARVKELEDALEARDATIVAYRLREARVSAAPKCPQCCPSVSPQGTACELDTGHAGSHSRRGDGVVRSWGG